MYCCLLLFYLRGRMDISNALLELQGGSYKARYLLLVWIKVFGSKQVNFNDIKTEHRFALSLSEKSLRLTIAELVKIKAIEPKRSLNTNDDIDKGFILHEDFNPFATDNFNEVSRPLDRLISSVLFHFSKNTSKAPSNAKLKDSHYRLTIDSRLLLAVLLSRTTECGVVDGVGIAELAKITGMGKDKVKNHIEALTTTGFIRYTVTGVTGKGALTLKPSIYYLNIKHESFDGTLVAGDVYVLKNIFKPTIEAKLLFLPRFPPKSKLYSLTQKELNIIFNANKYFSNIGMHSVNYLQALINKFSSHLLSLHWNKLSEADDVFNLTSDEQITYLMRKLIDTDLFYVKSNDPKEENKHAELLVEFVLLCSFKLAKSVQSQLKHHEILHYADTSYVVSKLEIDEHRNTLFYVELFSKELTSKAYSVYDISSPREIKVINMNHWKSFHKELSAH